MVWSRERLTELDLVRRTPEPPFLSVFALFNSEAMTLGSPVIVWSSKLAQSSIMAPEEQYFAGM